jgi:hypothetical protein
VQDRDGAKGLLLRSRRLYSFVERVFADGGYAGKLVDWAKDKANLTLEIVRRSNLDANRSRHNAVQVRKWFIELVAALLNRPHDSELRSFDI